MNEMQQALLGVFQFTIGFLEQHQLRYCACGGTVLGAVRHHGFIPWDDDIDIYMPRQDYERLIAIRSKLEGTGYSLLSAQTNMGYYCPFAKISKDYTTIWEFKYYHYIIGVYIDIFPLDYYEKSDAEITQMQHQYGRLFIDYQKSLKTYSATDYLKMILHGKFYDLVKNVNFALFYKPRRKHYYNRWLTASKYISTDETGSKCVCLTQWDGRIFYSEWFEHAVDMPFESISIKIPRDYDTYLRLLYQDYMKLPPVEKRVSDHQHHYVNMNLRLSVKEIKKELKSK